MEGNEMNRHLADELYNSLAKNLSGAASTGSCCSGDGGEEEEEVGALLQPGELVRGRDTSYRVLRILGEGNCSIVYSAENCHSKQPVAIKVFRRNRIHESVADREHEILSDLSQDLSDLSQDQSDLSQDLSDLSQDQVSSIIKLLAAFEYKELFCFVFEQLDLNIRQLIMKNRRRGLPGWTVQKFAKDVLKGLKHIHKTGYVHGDIKPGNIMWSGQQGVFKCFDFGLSFAASDNMHPRLVHSPGYRAPEVLAVERVRLNGGCSGGFASPGAPSDIWAFGCMLLESIAGRKLFRTGEIIQRENSIISHVDKLLEESQLICSSLSSQDTFTKFRNLLVKCLETDPDQRITASEALDHPALESNIPVSKQDNILLISPVLKFPLHVDSNHEEIEEKCRKYGSVLNIRKINCKELTNKESVETQDAEQYPEALFVHFEQVQEAVKARNQFTCPSSLNRFSVYDNIIIMDRPTSKEDESSSKKVVPEFYPLELWKAMR